MTTALKVIYNAASKANHRNKTKGKNNGLGRKHQS